MNIKNIFNDPRKILAIGALFLGIGFIDAILVTDASSIAEMTWWGKASTYGFMGVLGALAIRFFVLPLGGWFVNLFKKK
jgi:hypothetical protein